MTVLKVFGLFALVLSQTLYGSEASERPTQDQVRDALTQLNAALGEAIDIVDEGRTKFLYGYKFELDGEKLKITEHIQRITGDHEYLKGHERREVRQLLLDPKFLGASSVKGSSISLNCAAARPCLDVSKQRTRQCRLGNTQCLETLGDTEFSKPNWALLQLANSNVAQVAAVSLQTISTFLASKSAELEDPGEFVKRLYSADQQGMFADDGIPLMVEDLRKAYLWRHQRRDLEGIGLGVALTAYGDFELRMFQVLDTSYASPTEVTVSVSMDFGGPVRRKIYLTGRRGEWLIRDICSDGGSCYREKLLSEE